VRIGIVPDGPLDEQTLRRSVALQPAYRVVWSARSAAEAIERCAGELPDLVLIGLQADGVSGVDATRQIMSRTPCPILIVSGNVRANAARVFEAIGHGALDAVDMPDPTAADLRQGAAALLGKIHTIGRLLQDGRDHGRRSQPSDPTKSGRELVLVAIGASAGGPAALSVVLGGLPKDFPGAIVIVQHVDAQFVSGMAAWLGDHCRFPVAAAKEGQSPSAGTVLIAGTSDHLVLKSAHRLGYTAKPEDSLYRPSIDVCFESVSRLWRGPAVGVLLTGMGSDGAVGLRALRDKGHHTIAQDRASSVVYGMPKAAAALDAAVEIQSIDGIAARLSDLVMKTPGAPTLRR
jgi:two-component system, chemotaxis family, response regulator WspF